MGTPRLSLRNASFVAVLVSVATGFSLYARAEEAAPKLVIVDRSVTKNDLYTCTLEIPKSLSFDMVVLTLKDRKGVKVGEVSLGTMDLPKGKLSAFFLNHELVKNSVVVIALPLDDPRENIKFVVGDQGALIKKDGKTVTVPIE